VSAGVLGRIVARTREAVAERKRDQPLENVLASAPTPGTRRSFRRAIGRDDRLGVIGEFKRRSPSRGLIREDLHPVRVAQAYEVAGAAALSVLTEERYFGGHLDDLQEARAATLLPTLRKDFIVDPYQIREAWIAGADAVLLIVAALSDAELRKLLEAARDVAVDALVEVHTREELDRALDAGAEIVGVNNRDLLTLEVRLETCLELAEAIPGDRVRVAESGIRAPDDVRRIRAAGYHACLVGEHLMLAPDPGDAMAELAAAGAE
jgi:indole-3-glycerol phosphate synthase